MRRITLDAHVLAPGFTSTGSVSVRLLHLWRESAFELVLSEHLLQELARTLTESYFVRRFPAEEATAALAQLATKATITDLSVVVDAIATHPEDDLVLSTALSGDASILCTRDKQLLRLGEYQTVSILSPGELLALLEREAAS